MLSNPFRYADGAWPNVVALSLTLLGWPLGIALLTMQSIALNVLGVLLVWLHARSR